MKRRTRLVLRTTISVMLGVVTSVGIAWTIAFVKGEIIATPGEKICIVKPDALLTLNEARALGRRQRMIWYVDSIQKRLTPEERTAKQQEWETARAAADYHRWPDSWLSWGDLERPQETLLRRRQTATGFPLICLWYERSGGFSMFGTAMRVSGGYEITKALGRERTGFVAEAALGYRPIWPGLLFNILFYATLWFACFTTLASWRRRRMRRRGICHNCRYDLQGLPPGTPCPECGTPS